VIILHGKHCWRMCEALQRFTVVIRVQFDADSTMTKLKCNRRRRPSTAKYVQHQRVVIA
jgi:hypothetical protein